MNQYVEHQARVSAMGEAAGKNRFIALNMFDVADLDKYLAYFSRLPELTEPYGARPVAFGRVRDNVTGDVAPRQVLLVVEWESEDAFTKFRDDPALADFHPLRETGTASYIWHTFDGVDLLHPDLTLDDIAAVLTP